MAAPIQSKPIVHVLNANFHFTPQKIIPKSEDTAIYLASERRTLSKTQQCAFVYTTELGQRKQEKVHTEKVLAKGNSQDRRYRIDNPREWPFACIGQLTIKMNGKTYGGTGTLVGPHHFLTCAHNVYNVKKRMWAEELTVYTGLDDKLIPSGEASAVKVFTYTDWTERGDQRFDIALLILDQSLGQETGWAGLLCESDDELTKRKVRITGYPGDKGLKQLWGMRDTISKISPEEFEYEIDTCAGQSGSPIWLDNYDNPMIIGIHTLGGDSSNSGVRLSAQKFSQLVQKISETFILVFPPAQTLLPAPTQPQVPKPAASLPFSTLATQKTISVVAALPHPASNKNALSPATPLQTSPFPAASAAQLNTAYNWSAEPSMETVSFPDGPCRSIIKLNENTYAHMGDVFVNFYDKWNGDSIALIGGRIGRGCRRVGRESFTCIKKLNNGRLATASAVGITSDEAIIRLWNQDGTLVQTYVGHTRRISCILELRDGTLVSGSWDKTVIIWNRDGTPLNTFYGHTDSISDLIELDNGNIASISRDYRVKVWNRNGKYQKLPYSSGFNAPTCAPLLIDLQNGTFASTEKDPDNKSWAGKYIVNIWGSDGSCLKKSQEGHTGEIEGFLLLRNGTFVTSSRDKTVKLWDKEGNCLETLQGSEDCFLKLLKIGVFSNTLKGCICGIHSLFQDEEDAIACGVGNTLQIWTFPKTNSKTVQD